MEPIGKPNALAGFKRLAVDVLAGWMFLAVFLVTGDIFLATGFAVAAGVAQAGWMVWHKQKIDPMQFMAFALVIVLGTTSILTHNPTFVVFKPSIFEAALAVMMLRPGWMARYAPQRAHGAAPRLMLFWGYLWAAAWFALAVSNLVVAQVYGLKAWAIYTNFSPFVVLGVLFGAGAIVFPAVFRRRAARAALAAEPAGN